MTFIAALLILVRAVLAGAFEVPAPASHGVTVSPATPAPAAVAPTPSHGRAPTGGARVGVPPQRPAAPPTVAAGPSLDPANTQLPTEVIGRAVTCPDGSVGYVVDVELDVSCPDSTPAAP